MKKLNNIFFLCLIITTPFYAQKNSKKIDLENLDYKRSSIYLMMAENSSMPYAKAAYNGFYSSPFPDKYNDHNVGPKSFDFSSIHVELTNADISAQKTVDLLFGKGIFDVSGMDQKIAKYAKENKIASKMVAKWFGRNPQTGSFNTDLISERGFYDASSLEISVAKSQAIGTSALGDAGEQLIGKTFLVVHKFVAIDNQVTPQAIAAKIALETAKDMKAGSPLEKAAKKTTVNIAQKAYNKAASGYSVVDQALLYQLVWNDSIASIFYDDLWVDESTSDEDRQVRISAFNTTDLFKLKFKGKTRIKDGIAGPYYPGKKKGNEANIIKEGVITALYKCNRELQNRYSDFAIKVPLLTGGKKPTAKIGLKEGVNKKTEFDVFEERFDIETNKTTYKKIATLKVDAKKGIWDNRYSATEKSKDKKAVNFTSFKGGSKNLYPGMLIQEKTKNK